MAWMITKDLKGTNLEGKGEYADDSLVANCKYKFLLRDIFDNVIYEGISDQTCLSLKDVRAILFPDSISFVSIERVANAV